MNPVIKICGMRESGNILAAAELRPDMLGFIFYPGSSRFAGEILDPAILAKISPGIRKTGVFVNADLNEIEEIVQQYSLDVVQLHGDETPGFCCRIKDTGTEVIKAFNIRGHMSFKMVREYIDCTDYFLFDTMTVNHGGSGQKFDWELLGKYKSTHPFLLSGGIEPMDADKIAGITNPSFLGVDINSRFEIRPGLKDIEKIRKFINELRHKHIQL
jgi:phosphoribosylanthranilate isomerase